VLKRWLVVSNEIKPAIGVEVVLICEPHSIELFKVSSIGVVDEFCDSRWVESLSESITFGVGDRCGGVNNKSGDGSGNLYRWEKERLRGVDSSRWIVGWVPGTWNISSKNAVGEVTGLEFVMNSFEN